MISHFIKQGVVPAIVAQLPFDMLHKWAQHRPLLPYYHGVSDDEVPHVKHLYRFRTIREFRCDLEAFLKHYEPITLHQLTASLGGGQSLPDNAFLLTFDDGFREVYDVIGPILWQKGVSASFFIIRDCLDNADMAHHNKISLLLEHMGHGYNDAVRASVHDILADCGIHETNPETALSRVDYARRHVLQPIAKLLRFDFSEYLLKAKPYLTSEQVRKLLSQGFTIGGHSIDHPLYAALSLEEQLRQTRESIRFVRAHFNLDYGAFAFPHHDTDVGKHFFRQIYSNGELDVSFGTSGMVKEECERHLQRFPMEKTTASAERIIAYNYARGLQKRLVGSHIIARA
jgi:peptidoglycan/xylan/chitin deacetylase (PgdA/CDA1 family)